MIPIQFIDQLESTNKYCELLDLSQTEEFFTVAAGFQTAGVGQGASRWESEPGKNLTFSTILKPAFLPVADQFMITKVISLGITDWLRKQTTTLQHRICIKWPNDIYVTRCDFPLRTHEGTRSPQNTTTISDSAPHGDNAAPLYSAASSHTSSGNATNISDRKICGILTVNHVNSNTLSACIVGIGLNVNQESFNSWIPNPVSLRQLTGQAYMADVCLRALLLHIQKRYQQLRAHHWELLDRDYRELLWRRDEECCYIYKGAPLRATITDVNRFGHLMLTDNEGNKRTAELKELKFMF